MCTCSITYHSSVTYQCHQLLFWSLLAPQILYTHTTYNNMLVIYSHTPLLGQLSICHRTSRAIPTDVCHPILTVTNIQTYHTLNAINPGLSAIGRTHIYIHEPPAQRAGKFLVTLKTSFGTLSHMYTSGRSKQAMRVSVGFGCVRTCAGGAKQLVCALAGYLGGLVHTLLVAFTYLRHAEAGQATSVAHRLRAPAV